jgi:4-phytase / acid phosphatase
LEKFDQAGEVAMLVIEHRLVMSATVALLAAERHDKLRRPSLQLSGFGEGRLRVFTSVLAVLFVSICCGNAALAPAARRASPAASGELKLVVALFRHGVRAPLEGFGAHARDHSNDDWPDLVADWHVRADGWGDLTPAGTAAAQALGVYYARTYSATWPNGFKAYLWADAEDERTRETAQALARGLRTLNAAAEVGSFPPGATDPLFHPFKAGCGTPNAARLQKIAADINRNWMLWRLARKRAFGELSGILACTSKTSGCKPLDKSVDEATPWTSGTRPSSPIIWKGQFPYASSASEAFLLEYANAMPADKVGWGRVSVGPDDAPAQLRRVLALHEFYFDRTEREHYLAWLQGSNLVREILDQLNRKAGRKSPADGQCPCAKADSQFVGLVGHDTNLAEVGSLLRLRWAFDDAHLPSDTRGLPANDALPAGALTFELRQKDGGYFVSIAYVAQALSQIRNPASAGDAHRLAVACRGTSGESLSPCEMTLDRFDRLVESAIGSNNPFLSSCRNDLQVCTSATGIEPEGSNGR